MPECHYLIDLVTMFNEFPSDQPSNQSMSNGGGDVDDHEQFAMRTDNQVLGKVRWSLPTRSRSE